MNPTPRSIPRSNSDHRGKQLDSDVDCSLSLPFHYRPSSVSSSSTTTSLTSPPSSSTMSAHSHHRRRSVFANGSSDEEEGNSLEFPRGAVTHPELSLIDDRDPSDIENENEHSLFIGASPVSTTAHHASKLTLNAGIFSSSHHNNHHHGMGDEFDPDRSVARLIRELGKGTSSFFDSEEREEGRRPFGVSTGHNAQSTTTTTANASNNKKSNTTSNHRHQPRQPSPLRKSPITAPTFTDESFMDDTPRPSRFDRESGRTAGTGSGSGMGDFSALARQMRGELDAIGGVSPVIPAPQERKSSSSSKMNGVGKGMPTSFTQEKQKERSGIRVESGNGRSKPTPSSSTARQRQSETTPQPRKVETRMAAGTFADLTGLTGMLETPARGLGHKDVGEDAAVPGDGASIPISLAALQTRLRTLQSETTTSRSRIRSLELDLERIRVSEAKALRSERELSKELEKDRAAWDVERTDRDEEVGIWRRRIGESERERDEWKGKWEKVVAEKEDLENIIHILQDRVATLTRDSESELAKIQSLRRQLATFESRSQQQQQSASANGLVDQLLARVEVLEGEVERLKTVVDEAVEVKCHERRGLGVPNNKAPISRSRQSSGKSQFDEGVQAAAYDGAPRSSSAQHQHEDDGHSSPTPRQSGSPRHSRRQHHRERSTYQSRSVEPQDPAVSPFPAIRGEDLERDFFSPQKPIPMPKHGVRIEEDLVDEGYGGEEHDDMGVKIAEIEKALASDKGEVPPQTAVMSVLREIEDDYKHYLSIYTDLANQYKRMSPLSSKRSVLAEHLKEVIDTMESKASQVARLTSALEFKDKTYRSPVLAAAREHKARMSVPETVRAIRKDLGREAVRTPKPVERKTAGRR